MIKQKHDGGSIDLVSRVDDALMKGWWNARTRREFCELFGIETNEVNRERIRRAVNMVKENKKEIVGSCGNGYFLVDSEEGAKITIIFRVKLITGSNEGLEDFIKNVDDRMEFDAFQLLDSLPIDQNVDINAPDQTDLDDFKDT